MSNPFRDIFKATGLNVKDEAERVELSRPTFTKIVSNENDLPEDLTIKTLRLFASKYGQRVVIQLEPIEGDNGK